MVDSTSLTHTVTLVRTLDLRAAAALAAELLLLRGSDIVVDASQVERLGGQCLQVLLSAVATWSHDGCALTVVHESQEFIEGLKLLGMSPNALLPLERSA